MTLRTLKKRPFYGSTSQAEAPYEAEHRRIARKAAADGIVLLKNDNNTLPLVPGSKVAVYGPGATQTIKGGTGSGDVNERDHVSICQGLINAGFEISNMDWIRQFDEIYARARWEWREVINAERRTPEGSKKRFFFIYSAHPFFMPDGPQITNTDADTAIYVISRVAGEGSDRFLAPGDYFLTEAEQKDIEDICAFYRNVILVINAGGQVDLSFTSEYENIRSILYIAQPGMEGGNAFADVISGRIVPSGKLTSTWALKYEDYPNAATFSHINGDVTNEKYEEGIYVGYRYFDTFEVPAAYGFGHGLSYTDFCLEPVALHGDAMVHVSVKVTNTGREYSGREVVQAYVTAPAGKLEKEYRRLCAFAKTKNLAPGESEVVELSWSAYSMASYDEATASWILDPGDYLVWTGDSLDHAVLAGALHLAEDKVLAKNRNICPVPEKLNELSYPSEKRAERYQRDLAAILEQQLPLLAWDLSDLKTQVIDYEAAYEVEEDEASRLVDSLSTEQLIRMATGDPSKGQGSIIGAAGLSVAGSAGETSSAALEQGIATLVLADGPAGLRLAQTYYVQDGSICMPPSEAAFEHGFFLENYAPEGTPYYQYCTAIPVGTLLAQTWDEELLREVGTMIAEEMSLFGVTLWLAPGMNIHRNPLCGRNFEYYSEDPLVSGKIAAAMTMGVQSVPGCGTTIKHLACNNQEDNRLHSNSIISERPLREIYLKGFEIAVKESKPMSIMTSYNLINGVHAANSRDLCTVVARQEWGFDGLIMSDWNTTAVDDTCTAAGCMRAGNDLIMPGHFSDHENMKAELDQGSLTEADLKKCITRLVRTVFRSALYE